MWLAVNFHELGTDLGETLLVALALLGAIALAAHRRPPAFRAPGDSPLESTARWIVISPPPRRLLAVLTFAVACVILMGTWAAVFDAGDRFRLNREHSLPTYFTTLLFFVAGGIAALVSRAASSMRGSWLLLGLCLLAFGVSEGAELHERLEVGAGIPTLVAIAPLGALALVALANLRPVLRSYPPAPALITVAIALWLISQAIDPLHAGWKSVVEESLELVGTTLFIAALILPARHLCQPGDRDSVREAGSS